MFLVLVFARTSDEQIVNIRIGERQATYDTVHEALKSLCGVAKAKRHSDEFKQSERCSYSCFRDVLCFYRNLVICPY